MLPYFYSHVWYFTHSHSRTLTLSLSFTNTHFAFNRHFLSSIFWLYIISLVSPSFLLSLSLSPASEALSLTHVHTHTLSLSLFPSLSLSLSLSHSTYRFSVWPFSAERCHERTLRLLWLQSITALLHQRDLERVQQQLCPHPPISNRFDHFFYPPVILLVH